MKGSTMVATLQKLGELSKGIVPGVQFALMGRLIKKLATPTLSFRDNYQRIANTVMKWNTTPAKLDQPGALKILMYP